MTRTLSKFAIVALVVGGIVGQAEARTVWHLPYKGAPYATTAPDRGDSAATIREGLRKQARKSQHSAVADNSAIVVAHHKPGYHDGLPRNPKPRSTDTTVEGLDAANPAASV